MAKIYRGLMVILDGLGDRPVPELGGCTPLENAHTPELDALAKRGITGLVNTFIPGVPVCTVTGTAALMGIPTPQAVIARGPIEAAGVGLKLAPGDVALRCNFATVQGSAGRYRLVDRRAGRIDVQTDELAEALSRELGEYDGISARVRPATEHRAVLALQGPDLSPSISDVDPGDGWEERGILPCRALDTENGAARRTAEAVNHFVTRSHAILAEHPVNRDRAKRGLPRANILLPRRAGQMLRLQSVVNALGLRSALVSGEATLFGLARSLGMTSITERGFTGNPETDLEGKARAAQVALETHDLVFLHVKGTDTLSHDGNAKGKRDMLQRIDRAFASLFRNQNLVIAVAADHSTACVSGRHTGDPVPVILASPEGRRDRCRQYNEISCSQGGLSHITGNGLIWSMLDQMGFTHNVCARDLPLLGYPGASWADTQDPLTAGEAHARNVIPLR
jgi:2,3-bisphosphoglycerate-independent phosphoglycerate mutase